MLIGAMVFVLLLALWIDHRFGEPPVAVHPVVRIGRYLQACGRVTVRCPPVIAFVLGALAWWLGAMLVGVLAWGLQALVFWQIDKFALMPGLQSGIAAALLGVLMAWLLKSMLSWRM